MKNVLRTQATVMVLWLLFVFPVWGQEQRVLQDGLDGYAGTQDNSIFRDRPDFSNGAHPFLYSGATVSSVRRALIRFDLTVLPAGSVIEDAELRLVVERSGPNALDSDRHTLHRIQQMWGEGSSNADEPGGNGAPADPGESTWREARFTEADWQTEGGDFAPAASATAEVGALPGATGVFASETLVTDIQQWIDNPAGNHGWMLIGDEEGRRNARRFASREYDIQQDRPSLLLVYRVETPVSVWYLY